MNFSYTNANLTKEKIYDLGNDLLPVIGRLQKVAEEFNYTSDESSINLPFDSENVEKVWSLRDELGAENLKYVVVIGIGGSNLGTKAIYDALENRVGATQILFSDTVNTLQLQKIIELLKPLPGDEYVINAISKSGKTLETIANLEVLLSQLPYHDRVVITTDEDSDFGRIAQAKGMRTLPIKPKVGGRYSVFSPVGLFPLSLCGFDIVALLEGAMVSRQACIQSDFFRNNALLSAIAIYANSRNGKTIYDNFFFNPELETLGNWYRQLFAESLGKNGKGITPTVSIGSTDLHSIAQLYLGGPKDKFFSFIYNMEEASLKISENLIFEDLVEGIGGKELKDIKKALMGGTKNAFIKKALPFTEFELEGITEKTLAEYMQTRMIEVMYIAQFMSVNAFDQPNVEDYKTETRELLSPKT